MGSDALTEHLDGLEREMHQLAAAVPSLAVVPRVVEPAGDGDVTIGRRAMRLLLALDERSTVAEHAMERGLVTTLRELTELSRLGLVTTEPPASSKAELSEIGESDASQVTVVTQRDHGNGAAKRPTAVRTGRPFWRRGLA